MKLGGPKVEDMKSFSIEDGKNARLNYLGLILASAAI